MKMGVWADALAQSLQSADMTFCYTKGLGWDPAQALSPLGEKASCYAELDGLVQAIISEAQAGDRIVVMSNGGFGGVHGMLAKALESGV
jgi:UDP-N-acetylmuramate: L-alanyl-gamma-D-glutamyl-meso-diaminopimelate ligase